MEPEKVEARPPALIDAMVRFIVPPSAREAVVGDLWERYRSPGQYIWEALRALPFVVASQIRRRSNLPILALSAFLLFKFFGGLVSDAAVTDVPRWMRAAVLAFAGIFALVLRDAYCADGTSPLRRAAFDVVAVIVCVGLTQAVLALLSVTADISPGWILPLARLMWTPLWLPLLFCLRVAAGYRLPRGAATMSAADLVREYEKFECGVRWRNRAIFIGGVLASAASVLLFWRAVYTAPAGAVLIGWAISTPLGLFVTWKIMRITSAAPMGALIGFALALAFYRRELERQYKLLLKAWWWYLLTTVPVVAGALIGRVLGDSEPFLGPLRLDSLVGYVIICGLVGWVYTQYARTFKDRFESLATLKEQL